jgi:type II secretory pathway pseudopilin PulG
MRKQHGITLIGFAIVLIIVGFFAYAAMKLVPVYSEYFGVVKSLKSLQSDAGIQNMGIEEIRRKLDTIFDVQYVDETDVPLSAVTLITANGQHSLNVAYSVQKPFIYNIDLLVHFNYTVDLSKGATY